MQLDVVEVRPDTDARFVGPLQPPFLPRIREGSRRDDRMQREDGFRRDLVIRVLLDPLHGSIVVGNHAFRHITRLTPAAQEFLCHAMRCRRTLELGRGDGLLHQRSHDVSISRLPAHDLPGHGNLPAGLRGDPLEGLEQHIGQRVVEGTAVDLAQGQWPSLHSPSHLERTPHDLRRYFVDEPQPPNLVPVRIPLQIARLVSRALDIGRVQEGAHIEGWWGCWHSHMERLL